MIEKVIHTLANHDFEIARTMPKGSGMLAFVIKGGDDSALKFMKSLELILKTSLGEWRASLNARSIRVTCLFPKKST